MKCYTCGLPKPAGLLRSSHPLLRLALHNWAAVAYLSDGEKTEVMRTLLSKMQTVLFGNPGFDNRPACFGHEGLWVCAYQSCGLGTARAPRTRASPNVPHRALAHILRPMTSQKPSNFKPGDWLCPNPRCDAHNFASKSECHKCHIPKPVQRDSSGNIVHTEQYGHGSGRLHVCAVTVVVSANDVHYCGRHQL